MKTSFVFLAGLLVSLLAGCDSTVSGGAGGGAEEGGGGGGSVEDGEAGEGGAGAEEPETQWPLECDDASRPTGCLHDAVQCTNGVWECAPTPLVLSFDGSEPVVVEERGHAFDLTGLGQSVSSDWPRADTPWLALDRDGDGVIADGTELFGSAVRLASGERARHGFEALAELDANGDRRVDAADPRFGELTVWADADRDRRSGAGELTAGSAGARRLLAIELDHEVRRVCDARGNCAVERARFTWADASGAVHVGQVVDLHLPLRDGR